MSSRGASTRTRTIDDFESGQTSAAFGGTTCHVDFIMQGQGQTYAAAFEEWRAKANGTQVIDMGYHMAVTDLKAGGTLEELASLPEQGITSYKLFMAYKGASMVDDETLFRTMQVAARTGALVMVHAENGDAIDVLVKEALAAGHTEPRYHALTRPPETDTRLPRVTSRITRCCGTRCGPTSCLRSRPTTAHSVGTARRRSAATISRRSRTEGPGSRTVCR